jgi:hypothetical protein
VLVAGCGGGSAASGQAPPASASATNGLEKLTAQQVLTKTKAAIDAASSVHVKGTSGGVSLDLTVGRSSATGSITIEGSKIEILAVDGAAYMKADKAFWAKLSPSAATVLADKYVKVGAGATAQFRSFTSYATFMSGLTDSLTTPTLTGQGVVLGIKVVQVSDGSTTAKPGVLSVSNVGSALPVQITDGGTSAGAATFTDWSKPVPASAPPAGQVLDFSKVTS